MPKDDEAPRKTKQYKVSLLLQRQLGLACKNGTQVRSMYVYPEIKSRQVANPLKDVVSCDSNMTHSQL
jgi:hypothetical protein